MRHPSRQDYDITRLNLHHGPVLTPALQRRPTTKNSEDFMGRAGVMVKATNLRTPRWGPMMRRKQRVTLRCQVRMP